MIKSLRIDNFVLIDRVELDLHNGFTIVTGETGSGKSILLNALNLILGERADFSVIGHRKDKAVVEAEIDISSFDLKPFFEQNDIDYFDTTILRREINKQGRSRAFINDIPVGLNEMKAFSSGLIHIHSQYNTLELKNKDYQLYVLDVLSDNLAAREDYHVKFKEWSDIKKKLNDLRARYQEIIATQDYNEFQLSELLELNLDSINYSELDHKLNRANNAEEIKELFGGIIDQLESENGVIDRLSVLITNLGRKSQLDPSLNELQDRLSSAKIELNDIAAEAQNRVDQMDVSEEDIVRISELIDNYNRILSKHQLNDQEELITLRNELSQDSESTESMKLEIDDLESVSDAMASELYALAEKLSENRIKSAVEVEQTVQEKLSQLKLEGTTLEFRITEQNSLNEFGKDVVEIYFSPNKGSEPVPVHRAASGGELSRVMLALQNLMCQKVQLKTILFDEIDTGVSGDVAQRIGDTLRSMGRNMQVIAITHLPQVAARGEDHYKVSKREVNGVVQTEVSHLTEVARVEEVARLMSGDKINEAALENAKALML